MKKSWTFVNRPANARRDARPDTRLVMTAIILLAGFALLGAGIAPGGTAVVSAQAVGPAEVAATAPLISYQGRLVDPATGLAKPDGQYPMSFRLYTVAAGGGPLYTEWRIDANAVNVVRSIFNVLLGEVTPLDPNIFNGQPLFLGVTVGGDPEMTPRLRLAHAPYAIFAARAGVANSAALATTVVDGAITSAKIAANAVDSARVADESLTGADIANSSITGADISDASISGARVADESLTGADIANSSITGSDVRDGSLSGADIADGSVGSADISDGAGSGLDADFFDGRDSTMLPVAFGFIDSSGAVTRATKGVSSIWEAGFSGYTVTIEGEPYVWTDYVTTVTQANSTDTKGCDGATVSTGSDRNNLLVYFIDYSGAPIQCNFQFVTYKP